MMLILLRSCFALVLTSGVVSAACAQSSGSVVGSSIAAPVTETTATSPASLLPPTQLRGSKYSAYLIQRYTTDKKARAILHLFTRKQRGGSVWLATGTMTTAIIAWKANASIDDRGTTTLTVTPLGYGLLVGLFGGVGIGKLARFNNANLYRALSAHESGSPLPIIVTKKLKEKDYR